LQLWIDKTTPYGLRRNQTRDSSLFGVGDGFRFRFARWLMLKLSYEYAARLPSATEVFGDGILTMSNLELLPELSHNLNISPILELKQTAIGDLRIELTGFLRETRNQILVLGNANFFKYENVYSGRSLGVDAALNWTSPHRYVMLDGALSHQELRNTSQWGEFATNKGDRLPNKPSDFASWGARLHFEPRHRQQLEPFYTARYVGPFFRGWESKGDSQFKQRVPAQLGHGIGLTYVLIARAVDYSATIEIQNLTDAKLYDYFGAVRPGRSLWLTLTGGFH
jgi:outer membrane receptor protein involved in Fe transport